MKDNRYYVYRILDPRTKNILYIGKGTGGRCYFHFTVSRKNTSKGDKGLFDLLDHILDTTNYTQFDCVEILHIGLSDKEAKKIELNLIKEIGYDNLYNVSTKAEWMLGSKWMNNGKIDRQFLVDENIPDEFCYQGRIKSHRWTGKNRGKVWINDGKIQKLVYPENIPDGFVKGSLTKSRLGKIPWNKGLLLKNSI